MIRGPWKGLKVDRVSILSNPFLENYTRSFRDYSSFSYWVTVVPQGKKCFLLPDITGQFRIIQNSSRPLYDSLKVIKSLLEPIQAFYKQWWRSLIPCKWRGQTFSSKILFNFFFRKDNFWVKYLFLSKLSLKVFFVAKFWRLFVLCSTYIPYHSIFLWK